MPGCTLFQTAIGACGVAWGARGIVAIQLPERTPARTRLRLLSSCPDAQPMSAPGDVQRAIEAVAALLRGEAVDLSFVALDMARVPRFNRRVYDVARGIPPGATLTYGEVAARMGARGQARAVGQALGRNPFPIVVPCHRVVAADGRLGGFSAPGGAATKQRLLTIEGAAVLPRSRPRRGSDARVAPTLW
jgi:methylated-DNA-[protein]-cysteine S-methyltransferase